jgi:signal transduction histidine kinase
MRLRPRAVTLLVALLAGIFTDLVAFIPSIHFAYHSIPIHAMVETTATLIAFLATFLLWGRLRQRRGIDDLLLFVGLGVLALGNLLFAAAPAAVWEMPRPFTTWSGVGASAIGAALLAVAPWLPFRNLRDYERAAGNAVVAAAIMLMVTAGVVGAFVDRLPVGIDPSLPDSTANAAASHPAVLSAQIVIALLFGIAAVGFTRRAERSHDEFVLWLGAACAISTFARVNYVIYPSLYASWVYTGDILRLGFYVLLCVGAAREIGVYQRAHARSQVLEERRRIARDLHDGLAQELAFVATKAREIAEVHGTTELSQIRSAAERGLDESRRAIAALTRSVDEPFDVALMQTVEEVGHRLGTHVVIDGEPATKMEPDRQEQLLRIVREAVTNAARHGKANVITVEFTNGDGIWLCIRDDGIGFDPAASATTGFGLVSMRERAKAIGGELTIESRLSGGTQVEVVVP